MEYGPEHSKLIRQVFGEKEVAVDPGGSHWERWAQGEHPHFTCLRDRPDPIQATMAKPRHGIPGRLLGFLYRHTLGRLHGDS